jgi:glycolate oxidase iron-sulfur subunit
MALPLLVYQRSGLQSVVRAAGVLKFFPKRLAAMEALLPQVPTHFTWTMPEKVAAATSKKRGRVGMLTGCVQQVFFSHVNAATARVLSAEGFDVIIPASQPCCGALMVHSGLQVQAAAMARNLITFFEAANVDSIAINAAGCGSTMKEYGHLLRDNPEWAARAQAFSAKCKDITEILGSVPSIAPRHPLPIRIAYHDACHLRHAQGIHQQPRQLLSEIPQLEVAEIPESSLCCGSAGVYNLLQPEPAQQLGDRKVGHLLDTHCLAVVSANPGCLLQLMSGLRRRGERTLPAFHMVELLDASIRGLTPEQVLKGEKSLNA